jgi:hypothetical protein
MHAMLQPSSCMLLQGCCRGVHCPEQHLHHLGHMWAGSTRIRGSDVSYMPFSYMVSADSSQLCSILMSIPYHIDTMSNLSSVTMHVSVSACQ